METAGAQKEGQFYIAPPEPVALEELLAKVRELRMAAARSDRSRIVQILQAIVPDFRPDAHQLQSGRHRRDTAVAASSLPL